MKLIKMTEVHFEKKISNDQNMTMFRNKETRHTFNNHLQIIANLIEDNINKSCSGNIHQMEDIYSKIQTIALWYNSNNLLNENNEFNLEPYFSKLCRNIIYTYRSNTSLIKFNISAKKIFLNPTTIQPLSLILNELITHSFIGNQKLSRHLIISIELVKKEQYRLLYFGNGKNSYEVQNYMQGIAKIFTEQLNGHLVNSSYSYP